MNNIVYFDGVCGMCNYFVNFLIKQDKNNKLLFTPLQGETAKKNLNIDLNRKLDTVFFQTEKNIYNKSDAAIRILYTTGGIWRIFIVSLIVPKFIRDFLYDIIANNRYRWFGKKESCRIPTPEERKKFLS